MSGKGKETGAQVVSDLFGTALEWAVSAGSARRQYKYNSRLMKQQNQMNIDMWNMNNAYNHPAAQMERYQEAGLNPNLLYGNIDSGNASSPPEQQVQKYQAPQYKVRGLTNIAATMLQERTIRNQEKLTDAEVNLKRQQTISESMSQTTRLLDNLNKQLDAARKSGDIKLFWDTYEDKKRAIGLQNDNLLAQRDLTLSTKDKIDTENQIGKYNLEVQLPLHSEQLRKQIRKLDDEHVYQDLMNIHQGIVNETDNEILRNIATESGLKVSQIEKELDIAAQQLNNLKQQYNLSEAETIIMFINSLSDVQGASRVKSQEVLAEYIEKKFGIKIYK